jgi:hypothetical protein
MSPLRFPEIQTNFLFPFRTVQLLNILIYLLYYIYFHIGCAAALLFGRSADSHVQYRPGLPTTSHEMVDQWRGS